MRATIIKIAIFRQGLRKNGNGGKQHRHRAGQPKIQK